MCCCKVNKQLFKVQTGFCTLRFALGKNNDRNVNRWDNKTRLKKLHKYRESIILKRVIVLTLNFILIPYFAVKIETRNARQHIVHIPLIDSFELHR